MFAGLDAAWIQIHQRQDVDSAVASRVVVPVLPFTLTLMAQVLVGIAQECRLARPPRAIDEIGQPTAKRVAIIVNASVFGRGLSKILRLLGVFT